MPSTQDPPTPEAGFQLAFHVRMLGSAAPVFPGFEVDICDRVDDEHKPDAVWHRGRAKAMIKAHPEIKELCGNTPLTAVWCVLFASLQIALAVIVSRQSFWMMLVCAYVVGSWINMNLFMLAHECNHNLVFKKTSWNRWLFTLASLPMFMSAHHTWWVEHHVHHNDLGAKKDFTKRRRSFFLLTRKRFFWFTQGPIVKWLGWLATPLFTPYALFMLVMQALRSGLGLIVYAASLVRGGRARPGKTALSILADSHLATGYEKYGIEYWAVAYPTLSLGMTAALFFFCGWQAVVYLLLSQLFMTGFLHPLMFGMILSNSHFHGHRCYQPTSSNYGWLNRITFNFGLHTEHHDLERIPWSRLPRMRKLAPESYDHLVQTKSYVALAFQFVFGPSATLDENFGNEIQRNLATVSIPNDDPTKPAPTSSR